METTLTWQEKMRFNADVNGHQVVLDAPGPLGTDQGPSPKTLALTSIGGCTAMDVVSLLKKYRQVVKKFTLHVESELTSEHPKVFSKVQLTYNLDGEIDPEKALEATRLSMTKYCGVSAMFSKSVPLTYEVIVNGVSAGRGQAEF